MKITELNIVFFMATANRKTMSYTVQDAKKHYAIASDMLQQIKQSLAHAKVQLDDRRKQLIKAELASFGATPQVVTPPSCWQAAPDLEDDQREYLASAEDLAEELIAASENGYQSIVARVESVTVAEVRACGDISPRHDEDFVSYLYHDGGEWHYTISHKIRQDVLRLFSSHDHQALIDFHEKMLSLEESQIEVLEACGFDYSSQDYVYETMYRRDVCSEVF